MKNFLFICLTLFLSFTNAFATDYVVSGSPDPRFNGTYIEQPFDCNGYPIYIKSNGSEHFAIKYQYGYYWSVGIIYDIYDPCNNFGMYFYQPSTSATPPSTGWQGGMTVEIASEKITFSQKQFIESINNNGTISNSITIKHNNFNSSAFSGNNGENFVTTGKVSVSNLPAGLTASVIRTNSLTLVFTLSGTALSHNNINDISNLTLSFNNSAFLSNNASIVNNANSNFSVNFVQVLNVGIGQTFSTIASAVNAADKFDILLLEAQTFTESGINLNNKSISIIGKGPSQTIVQAAPTPGTANNRVFLSVFDNYDESSMQLFEKITIRNGNHTTSGYPDGGGAFKATNTNIKFKDCYFESNTTTTTPPDGYFGNGGGAIQVQWCKLNIENCTFYDNKFIAVNKGDFMGGGAIAFIESFELSIVNSTFSNNSSGGKGGGALFTHVTYFPVETKLISVTNCTFTQNSTAFSGGAFYGSDGYPSTVQFKNSIFYGNTASNGGPDIFSEGYSSYLFRNCLIGNTSSVGFLQGNFTNCIVGQNPQLGTLQYNGGHTKTISIAPSSPAIDAGFFDATIPNKDQRGVRVVNLKDIGSYEVCTPTSSNSNLLIAAHQLPYNWNGLTFNNAGTQTKMGLTNTQGCDSSATLNLSVLSLSGNSSFCINGSTVVSANLLGGSWINRGRYSLIDNGNGTATLTGVNAGTTQIDYILNGVTASLQLIVNALPSVPNIAYAPGGTNPQAGAPAGSFCRNRIFNLAGFPSGGTWSALGTISINANGNASIGNSTGLGSVTYTVTNSNGCSNSRTMGGNVVACASRGTEEASKKANFFVYPNPAKNILNIKVDNLVGKGEIFFTDLLGKQLKYQLLSLGNNTIDISNLAKGLYLISLQSQNNREVIKVVIE